MENHTNTSLSTEVDREDIGLEKEMVYLWILVTLSLIANFASLGILFTKAKLRRNRYYRLVICLSISDGIMSVTMFLILIRSTFQELHRTWTCLGFQTVIRICTLQSFLQTHLMAIERYITSSTMSRKVLCSGHSQLLFMLITWFISAIFCGIIAAIYGNPAATSCRWEILYKGNNDTVSNSNRVFFFILLLAVSILYILTIRKIQKSFMKVRSPPLLADDRNVPIPSSSSKAFSHEPVSKDSKKLIACHIEMKQRDDIQGGNHGTSFQSAIKTEEDSSGVNMHVTSSIILVSGRTSEDGCAAQTANRATPGTVRRLSKGRDITVFKTWHVKCQMTAGIIIAILIVTYLPGIVDTFLKFCFDAYNQPRGFSIVIKTLPMLNIIINPLVYLWRIRTFRDAICCRKRDV